MIADNPITGYEKKFRCDNCDLDFLIKFPKGVMAEQPECPQCGIHPDQLVKKQPPLKLIDRLIEELP